MTKCQGWLNASRIKMFGSYGVFYLGQTEFLFDTEDLPVIRGQQWYQDKDGYLASSYLFDGRRCFNMFHRVVMHAKPGQSVDHINKDKTDNRKQNLRFCVRSENNMNRTLFSNNTSGVTGVYYDKKRRKWVANIVCNHKRIFIGRFDEKEEAVIARLQKEMELFKEFAPQRELYEKMGCYS